MPRAQQMQELMAAARRVFDERGVEDAQMDDIAQAAGISKGGIYRHFASKEELRVSTVLVYLDELGALLEEVPRNTDPVEELLDLASTYLCYGMDHPAFLDCCLALLRHPAEELAEEVSLAMMLRVTQAMARSLRILIALLERGREAGAFELDDPDAWANYWYARALGSLHLTRVGAIVCPSDSEVPTLRAISPEQLESIALQDMLADVGVADPRGRVAAWRERVAHRGDSDG
jgi:AcrR family transcriptional regulator